jgi:hypothetical protein
MKLFAQIVIVITAIFPVKSALSFETAFWAWQRNETLSGKRSRGAFQRGSQNAFLAGRPIGK